MEKFFHFLLILTIAFTQSIEAWNGMVKKTLSVKIPDQFFCNLTVLQLQGIIIDQYHFIAKFSFHICCQELFPIFRLSLQMNELVCSLGGSIFDIGD